MHEALSSIPSTSQQQQQGPKCLPTEASSSVRCFASAIIPAHTQEAEAEGSYSIGQPGLRNDERPQKTSSQKASKQIKKHCFPSKDSHFFWLAFFLAHVCEIEKYSLIFSRNTSLLRPLARRPRTHMVSVRIQLALTAFRLHEHGHPLSPSLSSFSLSIPLPYNVHFQVRVN